MKPVEFDEQIVEITSAYEAGSCHGSCKEGYGKYILWDKLKKVNSYNIEDIVFLSYMGLRPVLVHGGGPNISDRMRKSGKKTVQEHHKNHF